MGVKMMSFIAIYTVGRLKHPYEHPASREFFEKGYNVMRQAENSGQLLKEFSPEGIPFPDETIKGEGPPILTLTVWKSLESLYRFTYSGNHKQALRDRGKWIDSHEEKQPTYVLWWADKVKDVSWEEAFKRYDYYLKHGPSPFSFDYKHAFDEAGETFLIKDK
jgi:hypothetical protein